MVSNKALIDNSYVLVLEILNKICIQQYSNPSLHWKALAGAILYRIRTSQLYPNQNI